MAKPDTISVPVEADMQGLTLPALLEADHPVRIHTPADDLISEEGPANVADLLPPGWTYHPIDTTEIERDQPAPARLRGSVTVDSAQDLVTAVQQRCTGTLALYAQERELTITAVLNDDHGAQPGHGDYRVVAQLRRTPDWQAWLDGQGLHGQVEFAEFIEEHLTDIVSPPAADMLELAQTFHAHTTARFKSHQRLASGAVSLAYDEDQQVSAGGEQAIQIPTEFEIAVRPFYGCDLVKVGAHLRYRVGRGELQLGWKLKRPDDIERVIFGEQAQAAADAVATPLINGSAKR